MLLRLSGQSNILSYGSFKDAGSVQECAKAPLSYQQKVWRFPSSYYKKTLLEYDFFVLLKMSL